MHKELLMQDCWIVTKNEFLDLEPDNDFDIDLVAKCFVEDILQARFNDYLIDLGFYGNYYDNRNGFFKLFVIKGHFLQGELFEAFISRSTKEIKEKLDKYFDLIAMDQLRSFKGYKYGELTKEVSDFAIFSVTDNIQRNPTDKE